MIVVDASALIDVAEVLSALTRLERARTLPTPAAHEALTAATSLPQALVPLDAALVARAFELRERIRVVDALYVALAERLDAPLLTTDVRLAASKPPCEVLAPTG